MKAIVKDYLRRWKWVFILAALVQFASLFAPSANLNFSLFSVIYCGSVLLSFDFARGIPRVCTTLPVSRQVLARSWVFVAIIPPLALFVVNITLVAVIKGVFKIGDAISFSQATFLSAVAFLWLGLLFHLLTHLPSASLAQDPACKAINGFWGALWGLSVGGGFFVLMKMPNGWEGLQLVHWILVAGAFISTVLGWRRAEEMVINRASPARTGEDVKRLLAREKRGFGALRAEGLPFLFRIVISNALKVTLILTTGFLGVQIFLRIGLRDDWVTAITHFVQESSAFYILIPLTMISGLQWLVALRHFRSLPMKSSSLTLLVYGFFIFPAMVMIVALGLLQAGLAAGGITREWLSLACLMTIPTLLVPGLLLHFGLNWKSYFLAITPIFAAAPLAGLLLPYLSEPLRAAICVVAWAIGGLLIHRSITRRSQTYHGSLSWPMRPA